LANQSAAGFVHSVFSLLFPRNVEEHGDSRVSPIGQLLRRYCGEH
jgi:hypothetical protein